MYVSVVVCLCLYAYRFQDTFLLWIKNLNPEWWSVCVLCEQWLFVCNVIDCHFVWSPCGWWSFCLCDIWMMVILYPVLPCKWWDILFYAMWVMVIVSLSLLNNVHCVFMPHDDQCLYAMWVMTSMPRDDQCLYTMRLMTSMPRDDQCLYAMSVTVIIPCEWLSLSLFHLIDGHYHCARWVVIIVPWSCHVSDDHCTIWVTWSLCHLSDWWSLYHVSDDQWIWEWWSCHVMIFLSLCLVSGDH